MSYKHLVLPALLSSLLFSASTAQAQLYRWVDENGRTVVSDTPPPPQFKHQLIRKPVSGNSEAASTSPAGKEKNGTSQAKPGEQESAICAQARQNLQALESERPVTVTNAKGERVNLEGAARAEELAKVREALRNCKN